MRYNEALQRVVQTGVCDTKHACSTPNKKMYVLCDYLELIQLRTRQINDPTLNVASSTMS